MGKTIFTEGNMAKEFLSLTKFANEMETYIKRHCFMMGIIKTTSAGAWNLIHDALLLPCLLSTSNHPTL